MATPDAPLLEVVGVSKQFPGVRALDDVSFALRAGEVHALVGENGAGKSTLIKVLTGVYQPDGGELRHLGRPATFSGPLDAQAAGISTIYQEVNLVPLMSVARNLFLGREPRNRLGLVDVARMNREAARILAGYGITSDVRRPLGLMALGAQQMVALARAVMVDARVVIMDEPTSSLEPREVDTLFGVIQRLHERGVGIIYVSHRLDELYRVCDRVTVLRDGNLVHTGLIKDLDRLQLVSHMLGRPMAEVRKAGFTSFGGEHAAAGTAPVLRVHDLTSRHKLTGVSFEVRPGEVVGLGGLLGAGRSETIKAIAGALPLDRGTVEVAGKVMRRPNPVAALKAGIAVQPEDRKAEGIALGLSVRENIALAVLPRLATAGIVSERKIDKIVETFMQRLRIKASSPHQRVGDLSGGNQQKVLLARLLATGPKVLMLDEPTRGIDVGAKAEVQALIDELAAEGLGVVLVSSDAEELIEGSDRVVVLRDGAVAGMLRGDEVTTEQLMNVIAAAASLTTDTLQGRTLDPATLRRLLPAYGVYVALALLVLFNIIFTDNFLAWNNLRIQLVQVTPVVIVALGMALVIGTEGIDLSVGSVMALGAALIPLYLGYGLVPAILLALFGGLLVGLINGSLVAFVGLQPIVATLALLVAGRGVALVLSSGRYKDIRDKNFLAIGTDAFLGVPYTVWIAGVLAVLVGFVIRKTVFGRRLLAIGDNRPAAQLAGVPVKRVLITVYIIAAVLASIAGIVQVSRIGSADASRIGLLIELSAITAVVVGGTPLTGGKIRVLGTVAGAFLMQLLTATMIANNLKDSTAQMVQAAIILVAVYTARERRTR